MNPWLVGSTVFGAAWLAFCIWTVRRLLIRGDRAARRSVLGWAVPLWLPVSGVQWVMEANRSVSAPGELFAPGALLALGIALVVGFPFALWAGYSFGRMLAPAPPRRSGREER